MKGLLKNANKNLYIIVVSMHHIKIYYIVCVWVCVCVVLGQDSQLGDNGVKSKIEREKNEK